MQNRIPSLCLCCFLGLVAVLSPLAADESASLNAKEVKKALRKADKAYESGRSDDALPLYRQILASTEPGDASRASALYALAFDALTHETSDVPVRDYLAELLEEFPRHRSQEVQIVLSWLRERDATLSKVKELSHALDAEKAERQKTSGNQEDLLGQVQAMGEELEATRKELAATRKELAAAKAELAKKDEAIKKLRDTLVQSGG